MAKLQTNKQRQYRYETIARAEGEQCIACKIELGIRRGPPRARLIIEHADNDQSNWTWSNIHLCCYSHNKHFEKLPVGKKIKLLRAYSDQLERERERAGLPTWKDVIKDQIPYESGSPEMQAHKKFEPKWKKYVHRILQANGSGDKREIIRGAAKASGCSLQTSRNYLEKYTSEFEGPFKEGLDGDGNKIITYLDPPSTRPGEGKR